jgi:hypothetical protein
VPLPHQLFVQRHRLLDLDTTWSAVTRVPIDATSSTVDHFIQGFGIDHATVGSLKPLTSIASSCDSARMHWRAVFPADVDGLTELLGRDDEATIGRGESGPAEESSLRIAAAVAVTASK